MDEFWRWWILLPNISYWLVMPLTAFYFLCQYCHAPPRWIPGIAYAAAHACMLAAEQRFQVTGAASLLFELLLLTAAGGLPGRRVEAVSNAALVGSVFHICGGAAQVLFYWAFSAATPALNPVFRYLDFAREAVRALLAVCLLLLIRKYFCRNLTRLIWPAALFLAVPVFYISLVERTIRDSIYGDTIVVDTDLRAIFPQVRHMEMLLLQVFACVCLFLTLAAFRKITVIFQDQQTIQLLRQQGQVQETYIREAQSRYQQTQAFRHDIKNHLAVLSELLRTEQAEEAYAYLSHLAEIAGGLSFPVRTGCTAVDALLGSKLAAAQRKEIAVACELHIPAGDETADIDWCILLSNAVDNAIQASENIPAEQRFIHITGKTQANLYLLSVENACLETLTGVPQEGVGLANIRAVVEKRQGTVRLEAGGGVFRLDALLVVSHPPDCNSQQIS